MTKLYKVILLEEDYFSIIDILMRLYRSGHGNKKHYQYLINLLTNETNRKVFDE